MATMMGAKNYSLRWLLFVACVILGTFLGIFFQHFSVTAPLFRDVVNFGGKVGPIDLLAFRFAFEFVLRMNLGTLFGGIVGILVARR